MLIVQQFSTAPRNFNDSLCVFTPPPLLLRAPQINKYTWSKINACTIKTPSVGCQIFLFISDIDKFLFHKKINH